MVKDFYVEGGPNYTVSLVGTDGRVAAASTLPRRTVGVQIGSLSTSATTLYYLVGDGEIRFLRPNGDKGITKHIALGPNEVAAFAVSPDDRRIAVSVLDFTRYPVSASLFVEDLNGSANHVELYPSRQVLEWPVGWHNGSVVMGYGLAEPTADWAIAEGERCILAQEIRNARGGDYKLRVKISGEGTSADEFEKTFLANVTCKLVLFRFQNTSKDPRSVSELASAVFRPSFGKAETFGLDRFLGSAVPGANFSIGQGLGIAIVVAKTSPGRVTIPKAESRRAFLRIHSVTLDFQARARDENTIA